MIEERFGPYTVYECIGAGGVATVHRATFDRGDGVVREVALKRLLPQHVDDKTFVDDFVREGQIAARLHHPGIVAILDLGRVGATHFIAMELVHGQSMMQLIRKAHVAKRPAPIGVVIALISDLCDALDYACNGTDTLGERLNIIHRDLSPSNLLVADDGRLRVIDFGVAKAMAGRFATSTGLVKGKLGYMSIEALAGKPLDGRADVFSTGVVAWELLTGRRLYTGASELEIVQRVRSGSVQPPSALNPACPPTLDAIVQHALARSRDDRWPTAAAFRTALEQVRRAYREESTPARIMSWRDAIGAEPAPRHGSAAAIAIHPVEDPDEVTQHRDAPPRRPMVRAMTEIDLLDLEPAGLPSADEPPPADDAGLDPGETAALSAMTTFEAAAFDAGAMASPELALVELAPPAHLDDADPVDPEPASASATGFDATAFEAAGDGANRTFTGELAAHAFGGPTAQTAMVPQWPVDTATQLNIHAYSADPPSEYMEMAVVTEEPSLQFPPIPDAAGELDADGDPALDALSLTSHSAAELEMIDLEAPPREEMLDLDAPPEYEPPPREELLDLETEAALDSSTIRPMAPNTADTVIIPSSRRRP